MKYLIIYLIIINIISFLSMYLDKRYAIKHTRRIPEKTLFFLSLIGGALGSNIGMYAFKHKTKHLNFVVLMPILLILNVICIYLYMKI